MLLLLQTLKKILKILKTSLIWIWNKSNKLYLFIAILLALNYFQHTRIGHWRELNRNLHTQLTSLPKPEDFSEIKNEYVNLKKENKDLKAAIDYLKSKGEVIKYITRTKTIIQGGETVYKLLPSEHVFILSNEMPVAKFLAEDVYTFTTYDLTFNTDIVISDKNTLVKLTAKSSASNKVYDLPVEVTTHMDKNGKEEKEKKLLEPRLTMGAGASLPFTGPEIVFALPLLEGKDSKWSWIAPTVSMSKKFKIGLIPVMYNLAKPIPLVDNIWLGVGYETDMVNHYGAISISAKL